MNDLARRSLSLHLWYEDCKLPFAQGVARRGSYREFIFYRQSARGVPAAKQHATAPKLPGSGWGHRASLPLMRSAFVYQIRYDASQEVDQDFLPLDNTANERPDWFEYWAIRNFLRTQSLNENAFYGFFSPRFRSKTNLSGKEVHEFIRRHGDSADVLLFTPSLHLTAYHLNVFKYGDMCHPGLLHLATRFFTRIGRPTNLDTLITHSGNEVYSNYFVARPRFWAAWSEITERLFEIAESKNDPLGIELRKPTTYRGSDGVEMKVFLMERVTTWLLAREPKFAVKARDPFIARSRLYKLPGAIVCDAVKVAYELNGRRREFGDLFRIVSKFARVLSVLVRFGSFWRFEPARRCMAALATYWNGSSDSMG